MSGHSAYTKKAGFFTAQQWFEFGFFFSNQY